MTVNRKLKTKNIFLGFLRFMLAATRATHCSSLFAHSSHVGAILKCMNDDIITDLKQFISATVRQEGSSFKSELRDFRDEFKDFKKEIRGEMKLVNTNLNDIDAKLDTVIEAIGDQFEDHDQRITKLEAKAA